MDLKTAPLKGQRKILVVLGTRPEAIKLAPVIVALRDANDFQPTVCNTEQHKRLCKEALEFFDIKADINLDVMRHDQALGNLNATLLERLTAVVTGGAYDAVMGQGDTMTVFAAASVAFYQRIPFWHVEAGIRTYDLRHPFPEEMLRQCVTRMAALHFAPTQAARLALLKENISDAFILVSGNTVVDALLAMAERPFDWGASRLKGIDPTVPMTLVTIHRRENHGPNLTCITSAVSDLAEAYKGMNFIVPVHPNPNVKVHVRRALAHASNIHLVEPLEYPELIAVMRRSSLILTDSGGIQEEAPTFGVPLLVLREKTERMEGVEAGCAELVGADRMLIVRRAKALLDGLERQSRLARNPYGDGQAAKRILQYVRNYFANRSPHTLRADEDHSGGGDDRDTCAQMQPQGPGSGTEK